MIYARTVRELRVAVREARARGERIGLVATMGAFHEGHVSLMRAARERCGCVVVSLFVNPLQFNDVVDLERYPRDEGRDAAMADGAGVNVFFVPSTEEVYGTGIATQVEVSSLAAPLEGEVRGTQHFRGVATVVTKLFNMVQPDEAFFGQKDAQQALIIRRLARDLDFPVAVSVMPTVREADGLAMSSRNVLLTPEARARAVMLSRALFAVRDAVDHGERDANRALEVGMRILHDAGIEPEYLAAVSTGELAEVTRLMGETLIAIAARFGGVRLIDNVIVAPVGSAS